MEIKKSNLIKIPQGSILYENQVSTNYKYSKFIAIKEIKEPQIAIYLKNLDDEYSEIILGDTIFIIQNKNIFLYKEQRNAN